MIGNPGITVMQMESALNNMQNTMVSEDGTFNLDALMIKLKETREIAQSIREKEDI